jgi:purine-binding chemotaxis protein CheW
MIMDIAEIRKKAKTREQKADRERLDKPAQNGSDKEPTAAEPVPGTEGREAQAAAGALVSGVPEDGLDRLFAASDQFSLASEAAYADSLASRGDTELSESRQYLGFQLADEEYALDITRISEIIKVRELTDIPRSPEYVMGIISLRGVVVPVFDLRRRLNLGASEILPTSRIVVSQYDDITVGLLVDSINQVVNLADEDLEPPPGVLSGLDRDMLEGIGRSQGRMIILLNLQNVLDGELN